AADCQIGFKKRKHHGRQRCDARRYRQKNKSDTYDNPSIKNTGSAIPVHRRWIQRLVEWPLGSRNSASTDRKRFCLFTHDHLPRINFQGSTSKNQLPKINFQVTNCELKAQRAGRALCISFASAYLFAKVADDLRSIARALSMGSTRPAVPLSTAARYR